MKPFNPSRFEMPREPVTVEYTAKGERVTKTFPNAHAARRFYLAKDKAGCEPRIIKQPNRFVGNADDFTINPPGE